MTKELDRHFYRETVQGTGVAEGKVIHQRHGAANYAHIRVAIRALDRGQGTIFAWNAGSNIPAKFANAASQGIQDAMAAGILAGFELTDVCITVEDGSYHEEDSRAEAFREAAEKAVREAALQARPIVLEALSSVTITFPEDFVAVVEATVKSHGGHPRATQSENQYRTVQAVLPSSHLSDLTSELLLASDGQARISASSAGFRPRPEPPGEVEQWVVRA